MSDFTFLFVFCRGFVLLEPTIDIAAGYRLKPAPILLVVYTDANRNYDYVQYLGRRVAMLRNVFGNRIRLLSVGRTDPTIPTFLCWRD